jgi:hypothetical protein
MSADIRCRTPGSSRCLPPAASSSDAHASGSGEQRPAAVGGSRRHIQADRHHHAVPAANHLQREQ